MKQQGEKDERSSTLSAAKLALVQRRLRGEPAAHARSMSIPSLPPDAPRIASSSQARLFLLDVLYPDNSAYHIHYAVRLQGNLNRDALNRSLDTLVNRHDILRTTFEMKDAALVQTVTPTSTIKIAEHDCSSEPENRAEREMDKAAVESINRAFDLRHGPLLRADLFCLTNLDHLLVLTVHHIVADEWSMGIFVRELAAAYNACCGHDEATLPQLEIQYADYAAWQAGRTTERLQEQQKYWHRQLRDVSEGLELPFDRRRLPRPRFRGGLLHRTLPASLNNAVTALARQFDATTFMVWLAIYQCLLYRYTGESDICIGTPAANRPTPATEKLIGLFLNTLVMRGQIDGASGFDQLLSQTQQVALEAYANQDLPFEKLVAELRPERDLSHNPLFQTMFVMEARENLPVFDGIVAGRRRLDTRHAKLDMTLFVREAADGALLSAEYDSDLFDKETVDILLQRFHALTESIVADPAIALDDLSLTVPRDTDISLIAPVGTADRNLSVLERFNRQVSATPAAIAVVDGDRQVSYLQLSQLADRLSCALRARGAGSDALVPIMIGRSVEQIAAMLGVMKAGAAYVPLDPDYPEARHRQIVDQLKNTSAAATCLVSIEALRHSVAGFDFDTLYIDALPDSETADATTELTIAPSSIAYVIYTSGSSGAPKGVAITHANLAASTAARLDYYDDAPERYLLVSSFAFDSSVAGIYWTLVTGGSLILAPQARAQDPRALVELIERQAVTHTLMLPGLYALLLECGSAAALSSLRLVIVAGETCPVELVQRHKLHIAPARLYNEYGPTEATVWATVHECAGDEFNAVPIGRPVPGVSCFVVDGRGRLVPPGVSGELYIGGDGVAVGYLDGTERSNRAFVQDRSFGTGRIYRSGDRVRINRSNQLEFRGRVDEQVKIRGFRVETGEIETLLRRQSGIQDAAVVVERDPHGKLTGLVACICPRVREVAGLRKLLKEKLPDYMLPREIIAMDALPRMPNGKLNRRLLDLPDKPGVGQSRGDIVFSDETTEQLAAIWRQMLNVDRVSPDDDFFALGGHSLLGVSLMMEIERRFGVDLPLASLFETSTLAGLSEQIRGARENDKYRLVIPVRKSGTRQPLFCIHAGARLLAKYLPDNQPVYLAYQRVGNLDPEVNSVERMAGQYLAEIRQIQPHGPYALIGFSTGAQIAFEIARRLTADGESVNNLVLGDPPTHTGGTYYKRRLAQRMHDIKQAGGTLRRGVQAVRQAAGVALRRLNRIRLRMLSAYFRRTRKSGPALRRGGMVVFATGLLSWIFAGFWMNAPQWRVIGLPLTSDSTSTGTFNAPETGVYEIMLEVDVTTNKQDLGDSVLALSKPSNIDLQWEITGSSGRVVGGDARDYLYLDRGPVKFLGRLRRILLRVPFGQGESYFNSFGLFGNTAVARGLGKFSAQRGDSLTLRAIPEGKTLDPVLSGRPRLVARLSRDRFDAHYAKVVPLSYAGLMLGGTGALLLLVSFLRERQSVPENLIRFTERSHLKRISDRYEYPPYEGSATLVFPAYYRGHLGATMDFWDQTVAGTVDTHFIEGAQSHVDLVRESGGREIARLVRKLLDDNPGAGYQPKKKATS